MSGNFVLACLYEPCLCMLDFFNIIRVSNSLDPAQARHFVGADLGPNCLQNCLKGYQQTTRVAPSGQRVKYKLTC